MSFLPSVFFDGEYRVLGGLEAPPLAGSSYAKFQDSFGYAAGAPIKEIDLSWLSNDVKNQGSTNSCAGQASTGAGEICYAQLGNPQIVFSPYFTYAQINNGYDNGAYVSDAIDSLKKFGACPIQYVPKGALFKNQMPKDTYTQASRYKVVKAYKLVGFDQILQALNLGFAVVFGITVGGNFSQVDANGIPPLRPRGGVGGHVLVGCGIKKISGDYTVRTKNSWGTNFGQGGYCYLTEGHFSTVDNYGAYALQAFMDDPKDPDPSDDVPTANF
jgi:hypothetical protein